MPQGPGARVNFTMSCPYRKPRDTHHIIAWILISVRERGLPVNGVEWDEDSLFEVPEIPGDPSDLPIFWASRKCVIQLINNYCQ